MQDSKESFAFNLYYHFTFNMSRLPALIFFNLKSDGERAGDLVRYVHYLSNSDITVTAMD